MQPVEHALRELGQDLGGRIGPQRAAFLFEQADAQAPFGFAETMGQCRRRDPQDGGRIRQASPYSFIATSISRCRRDKRWAKIEFPATLPVRILKLFLTRKSSPCSASTSAAGDIARASAAVENPKAMEREHATGDICEGPPRSVPRHRSPCQRSSTPTVTRSITLSIRRCNRPLPVPAPAWNRKAARGYPGSYGPIIAI